MNQVNSHVTDEDKCLYFMVDEREKVEFTGLDEDIGMPRGYSLIGFECETPEDTKILNEALKKVKRARVMKG